MALSSAVQIDKNDLKTLFMVVAGAQQLKLCAPHTPLSWELYLTGHIIQAIMRVSQAELVNVLALLRCWHDDGVLNVTDPTDSMIEIINGVFFRFVRYKGKASGEFRHINHPYETCDISHEPVVTSAVIDLLPLIRASKAGDF